MASRQLSSCSYAEIDVPLDWRWVYQGIFVVASSKTSHLSCRMGYGRLHYIQYRRVGHHLKLLRVTPNNFTFLCGHQRHSRHVSFFLGILWTSIKQIKAPFMLYWEHGIAQHAMQGNRASSVAEGEVSWIFSSCGRNLGYILELWRVGISILVFLQHCQYSCLFMTDTSAI